MYNGSLKTKRMITCVCIVNREYFIVEIFSDSIWLMQKLNTRKYTRNVNDNAVQYHLSKTYLMRKIIA